MREFRGILIFNFITGWLVYFFVNWIFSLLGVPLDYFNVIIIGLVISLLYTLIYYMLIRSLLKPKLNFLNSETSDIYSFGSKVEKTLQVERSDFSFEVIKYKVRDNYHITLYEDAEKNILKFYTGAKLGSWGTGGCIEYYAVNKTLHLMCFPMVGHTVKAVSAAEEMMKKVENLIVNK